MSSSTLQLQGDPKKEYAKATAAGKKLLEKLYGAQAFKPNIMEQVKTMADVYRLAGVNPKDYVITKTMTRRKKKMILGAKLDLIEEVLNQGAKINMLDTNQKKWYPYFIINNNKSGFGFSCTDCDHTDARACGLRFPLCFSGISTIRG